jgi:hypothetical protein
VFHFDTRRWDLGPRDIAELPEGSFGFWAIGAAAEIIAAFELPEKFWR